MRNAVRIVAMLVLGLKLAPWSIAQNSTSPVRPTPGLQQAPAPSFESNGGNRSDTGDGVWAKVGSIANVITALAALATVSTAVLALHSYKKQAYAAREQAIAAAKEHRHNVHLSIFKMLDTPEIRAARRYVYSIDTTEVNDQIVDDESLNNDDFTYQKERWLSLDKDRSKATTEADIKAWGELKEHRDKAENLARALDHLGYLVREGIVPLSVVARFYTFPILKCWYKLCPYIDAVRKERKQAGHMWEWEHLVRKIIKEVDINKGIWKGAADHDNLVDYVRKIERRERSIKLFHDEKWNPPDKYDDTD